MLILSVFPGLDLLGRAFEEEWPEACIVRGPDLLWGGDIRRFHPPAGRFDGVIGGPPCQPFSRLIHLIRANGREPKHPNLIPEFERVVAEAAPGWFLMEEVPAAPLPSVAGYATHSFILKNQWLGEEQMRERQFSFGILGTRAIDLRRWIQLAALELPDAAPAVTSNARETPVAIGGSSKVKQRAVIADYDSGVTDGHENTTGRSKQRAVRGKNDSNPQPWEIANGRVPRYRRSWEECCSLQGLPGDFLADAPFTKSGRMEVLGNGVPLPMGRAIARAVRRALCA